MCEVIIIVLLVLMLM